MQKYNVSFVGYDLVGKTTLLLTYKEKKLPDGTNPFYDSNFTKKYEIENKEFEIEFWDTRIPDYDKLTPLIYIGRDVIAICFAVDNPYSFEKVKDFWIPDIEKHSPKSKRILIATKMDLRNNEKRKYELKEENKELITKEEGIELAMKIKAIKYFECSSLNQKGIETIFNEIPLVCIGKYGEQKQIEKKGCILN
ncbi:small gtpase rac1 [Anaeramoeba ignava]|uniref:Small gtpase rac1 n=1 Tax=Anaeramoeba ignava TaxID=1746090 RepID=A0A9Q0RFB2_ANAIG|nr:small gtpase rac1 [Anaeramoeba ignava]